MQARRSTAVQPTDAVLNMAATKLFKLLAVVADGARIIRKVLPTMNRILSDYLLGGLKVQTSTTIASEAFGLDQEIESDSLGRSPLGLIPFKGPDGIRADTKYPPVINGGLPARR